MKENTAVNTQETHVIFGTGPVGLAVMRELVKQGKCVRMVNRSGKADVPQGVEVVAADAYNLDSARNASKGATVIYQCAQPAYTEWIEKFPRLQATILEAAAAHGAKFVMADNLYMYGEVNGLIREDLPYAATTRKGRTRAQMAEAVMAAHRSGKVQVAIGRAADFFGPGALASAAGERLFYPLLAGKAAQVIGDVDMPHTYTYIDDFGKALAILGLREAALGQIWHVPSAETLTTRQFVRLAYEVAGQKPKIQATPKWLLRMVGMFMPEVREVVEMTYQFEKPFLVDHSKFARAFGDHATPHCEALKVTLDWYRANPKGQ
jgi:nucleoside-diphosphate-sugar epimerase